MCAVSSGGAMALGLFCSALPLGSVGFSSASVALAPGTGAVVLAAAAADATKSAKSAAFLSMLVSASHERAKMLIGL